MISIAPTTRPSNAAVTLAPAAGPATRPTEVPPGQTGGSVADKVAGWLWGSEKNESSQAEGLPMVEETVTSQESTVSELDSEELLGADGEVESK